jgi:nicotinamide-nucleotide amidase
MKAEIITIGDEILIGQTVNSNAAAIGEQLHRVGIEVSDPSS